MVTSQAFSRPLPAALPVVQVAAGVQCLPVVLVNVFFVRHHDGTWTLVDAGIPYSAARIVQVAESLFGTEGRPAAIVLTHGHFDHVGALSVLIERWKVPVYASARELPYLTGEAAYPPPDPTVGGGLMTRSSPLYPRGPYDFRPHIQALPGDGSVPTMPGWRWVDTPGHSPGHVSLFRDEDRVLLAGDAFITQKQESLLGVLSGQKVIHGPPMYFTADWVASKASVRTLADLEPEAAGTGHGPPIRGEELRQGLRWLAENFESIAVPDDGRYVREPARFDERGIAVHVPPAVPDPLPKLLAGVAVAAAVVMALRPKR